MMGSEKQVSRYEVELFMRIGEMPHKTETPTRLPCAAKTAHPTTTGG